LFEHWLGRTGETMYLGSRLVRLIERDTGSLIKESRQIYLEDAAQLMRGRAGNLPRGYDEDFLSNARGIPTWYAIPYPISEEVFIALGGVWFKRHYRGTVKKENQSTYRISLWTEFAIDKEWTFAPNEEMGLTENPPPEFNLLDTIGLPGWLPRPVLVHSPAWALLEHLLGARIPLSIGNPWSVYIPDEWAYALEQDGYATPFLAKGRWAHQEEFRAVDRNCDGWDVSDIVGEPKIVHELLPTGVDPAPSMSYGGVLDR
jgi:hypothetical protein